MDLSVDKIFIGVGLNLSYPFWQNALMLCRKKEFKIGDSVTVVHCWGGYRLPIDLPDGAIVKVLGREPSQASVGYQGVKYVVSIANIESGWEYRINGRWRDSGDPLVVEAIQNKTSREIQTTAG